MNKYILFLFLFLCNLSAYPQNFKYSTTINTDFSASNELSFLDTFEQKTLDIINSRALYYPFELIGYYGKVKNPHDIDYYVLNKPQKRTNIYKTLLIWNRSFDTCLIYEFSRLYIDSIYQTKCIDTLFGEELTEYYKTYNKKNKLPANNITIPPPAKEKTIFEKTETRTWLSLPINNYNIYLDTNYIFEIHTIIGETIKKNLNIHSYHGSLISVNNIPYDTIILQQVKFMELFNELFSKDGCKINIYTTPELHGHITQEQAYNMMTEWDSTNLVEDPNHPRVFVSAPIKNECGPETIQVVSLWKFEPYYNKYNNKTYYSFSKEIISIGIKFLTNEIIYYNYNELRKFCKCRNFNFEPFHNIFISESLKNVNLKLHYANLSVDEGW